MGVLERVLLPVEVVVEWLMGVLLAGWREAEGEGTFRGAGAEVGEACGCDGVEMLVAAVRRGVFGLGVAMVHG